jgi:hypothetical protein
MTLKETHLSSARCGHGCDGVKGTDETYPNRPVAAAPKSRSPRGPILP